MLNAPKIKITFEAMNGAGEQIRWLHAADLTSTPGLGLDYFPVFRSPETGSITNGRPLVLGVATGSRHTGVAFDTEEHRRRFFERLRDARRAADPELFLDDEEAGR